LKDNKDKEVLPIIKRSLNILSKKERHYLLIASVLNVMLALFDLLGVILIGLLGAISSRSIQSLDPGNRASALLELLKIESFTLQQQTLVLGASAAMAFFLKSILSIYSSKKILRFISARTNSLSNGLIASLFSQPLTSIRRRTSQEIYFSITEGVASITIRILGSIILLASDLAVLVLLGLGLVIADPLIALATFVGFIFVGYLLFSTTQKRGYFLGSELSFNAIKSNEKTNQLIESYREIFVRNQTEAFISDITSSRARISNISAELFFIPVKSKYIMESALVFFALLLAFLQFYLNDFSRAIATLSIFLVAGTRIAPAILRIQQTLVQIKVTLPTAALALEMIEELKKNRTEQVKLGESESNISADSFVSNINLDSVDFDFGPQNKFKIRNLNLEVAPGQFVAIVGETGSGKSTIVDLILGINTPTNGVVTISGRPPRVAFKLWPGAVSYVPQNITFLNGTIRSNLVFGNATQNLSDSDLWRALEVAQLRDFVESLPLGLDYRIGEHGNNLSGGQKQRLGIARALISNPSLLVLDEATSALDAQTEKDFNDSVQSIKGQTTLLIIAHRISTILNADKILYIEDGEVKASGTFSELKSLVPNFELQCKLLGL